MRVSVVINPKAGTVKADILETKIREALFRCDLQILHSLSHESMHQFISEEIKNKTDMLMACGGDGTINATLQILMQHRETTKSIPPICIICSGTANDLAHEIGISQQISVAARLILEGKEKKIDVIEISDGISKKYMLTNGGLGIPAITADSANQLRSFLQNVSLNTEKQKMVRGFSKTAHQFVKKMGSAIYSTILLNTLMSWKQKGWSLEVELPDSKRIHTIAPFILVNNQPYLARKFMTAPYTSNSDGHVNLTLLETDSLFSQLTQIVNVFAGQIRENEVVKIYEIPWFVIRTKNKFRKITFFGDGEILFRDVDELHVTCHKRFLSVMVTE